MKHDSISQAYREVLLSEQKEMSPPDKIRKGVEKLIKFPITKDKVETLVRVQNSHNDMIAVLQLLKWMQNKGVVKAI